jgi:hypothetical protein
VLDRNDPPPVDLSTVVDRMNRADAAAIQFGSAGGGVLLGGGPGGGGRAGIGSRDH